MPTCLCRTTSQEQNRSWPLVPTISPAPSSMVQWARVFGVSSIHTLTELLVFRNGSRSFLVVPGRGRGPAVPVRAGKGVVTSL